jgi:hypothetical protein
VTVAYSGDTIRPGESPEGKCWQASITYDGCVVELPTSGLTFTRDGVAAGDTCVVDDYPSHLSMDLTTTMSSVATGEQHRLTQVADLNLAYAFDGWRVASAHVDGSLAVDLDGIAVTAWGDLSWSEAAGGVNPYPVGRLLMTFPVAVDGISLVAETTATFDGTVWAYVQVRVGAWRTAFWLNLATGEIRMA